MPSVAAVSASEWKLPRREYARTSSSVMSRDARCSVIARVSFAVGVNVTHESHSGCVGTPAVVTCASMST